jgi:hypothetical protein
MEKSFFVFYLLFFVGGIASFSACAAGLAGADPSFAFASRDSDALKVVSRYFKSKDYINVLVANDMPDFGKKINKKHRFKLSASLSAVSDWASRPCNDPASAGLIVYDIEPWKETPASEQADITGSILRGAEIVKASGCRGYGLAPARAYLSSGPRECDAIPGNMNHQVNWKDIGLLVIQAQGLLLERCVEKHGYKNYVKFVSDVTRIVKGRNPDIQVLAEVSFKRSTPDVISQAILETMSFVDGFYLAYPKGDACDACTPQVLEQVLANFRKPGGASQLDQQNMRPAADAGNIVSE